MGKSKFSIFNIYYVYQEKNYKFCLLVVGKNCEFCQSVAKKNHEIRKFRRLVSEKSRILPICRGKKWRNSSSGHWKK